MVQTIQTKLVRGTLPISRDLGHFEGQIRIKMSSAEEQRLLKQKFLRREILEPGYDANEFSEYIGKKKVDGKHCSLRHRHR
jgi:hypothetical protein